MIIRAVSEYAAWIDDEAVQQVAQELSVDHRYVSFMSRLRDRLMTDVLATVLPASPQDPESDAAQHRSQPIPDQLPATPTAQPGCPGDTAAPADQEP